MSSCRTVARSVFVVCFVLATSAVRAQSVDMIATKDGPSSAAAGSNVSYDVSIINGGPDDTTAATLTDPIPAGMTFVSLTQTSGPMFVCTTPAIGDAGTISCSADLLAGAEATFTIVLKIAADAVPGTTYTNIASASSAAIDDTDENNKGAAATTVSGGTAADVFVTKNGPAGALPNSDVTYTITIGNGGPDDAQSVAWSDTLPGTMTFVSLNQNSGPTFNCTTGATVNCTIATLPSGATATFDLVGHIPAGTPGGTEYSNTATHSATTADPNPDNDSSLTTLVVTSTDLSITKSAPATVTAGTAMSYDVTVKNNGPDFASNVQWSDTLPSGETFASLVQNSGPAADCSMPAAGSGGTVSCGILTLANSMSATFTINVNVSPGAPSLLSNTATVSSETADPNLGNNAFTVMTTVSASADLAVTKSGPPTTIAGNNATFTITITNNGPSDAANVSLADATPPNTSFVSESQTSGPAFSCANGTCTIATLAAGASAQFTFVVKVNASTAAGTMITNSATASTTTTDPTPGNNSGSATTTVTTQADLAVTKSGPAGAIAGSNVAYTIGIANNGPSDAQNVSLADTIPAGTTFVSETQGSGPVFTCAAGTCTIATFAAGATAQFTLTVSVNAAVPLGTMLTNSVTATSTTSDPTPANNTASATTTVGASADLSLTKSGPATAAGATNISYTLTAANLGPSDATGVSITDALPASLTFVSITQNTGPAFACGNSSGTVTCTIATFANGATATFTLTATISGAFSGSLSNSATISATTTDPAPGNNSSTATTNVTPAAVDLATVKTAPAPPYGTGLPLTYAITVTNGSAPPANGVVVTDVLPAGMSFVSATASQGSCSGTTTVTCNLGTLTGGATATIQLAVTLPATPGAVSNTASVTSGNPDSNPANNAGTSTITVIPAGLVPVGSPLTMLLMALALAVGGWIALRGR